MYVKSRNIINVDVKSAIPTHAPRGLKRKKKEKRRKTERSRDNRLEEEILLIFGKTQRVNLVVFQIRQ